MSNNQVSLVQKGKSDAFFNRRIQFEEEIQIA
jgi:hypothetical protein